MGSCISNSGTQVLIVQVRELSEENSRAHHNIMKAIRKLKIAQNAADSGRISRTDGICHDDLLRFFRIDLFSTIGDPDEIRALVVSLSLFAQGQIMTGIHSIMSNIGKLLKKMHNIEVCRQLTMELFKELSNSIDRVGRWNHQHRRAVHVILSILEGSASLSDDDGPQLFNPDRSSVSVFDDGLMGRSKRLNEFSENSRITVEYT